MGIHYTAYTIIGQRIEPENLFEERYVIVDEHKSCETIGDGRFCSSCGKPTEPTKKTIYRPVDGLVLQHGIDETEEPDHQWDLVDAKIRGVDIVYVLFGERDPIWFVASEEHNVRDCANCYARVWNDDTRSLDWHRVSVKSALEPIGLWNPKLFGVWTALGAV